MAKMTTNHYIQRRILTAKITSTMSSMSPSKKSNKKSIQATYHRAVQRKTNLEVTGEEKPKTRLRRRKANKRLCWQPLATVVRAQKAILRPPRRRKASFTCPRRKKSHFAPSLDEKYQLPTYRARKKFNSVCENTFIPTRIDK